MGKAALFMAERPYPISMTYIHCMMAVCAINRKHKQEAQEEMLRSWELAKMDGFLEPLLSIMGFCGADRGLYPEPGSGGVSADHGGCDFFQQGWMALHNPENRRKVTGSCRRWSFLLPCWQVGMDQ